MIGLTASTPRALVGSLTLALASCGDANVRGGTDAGHALDARASVDAVGALDGTSSDAMAPASDADISDDAGGGTPDAASHGDGGPPSCETLSLPDFTATAAEPALFHELPMIDDLEYRSIEISYEVTVDDWPRECWNPAGAGGRGAFMGPFHQLAEIRKGRRFCRGGNLLETVVRAPGNSDLAVASYWAETIGSSCSGEEHQVLGSRPRHPLTPGAPSTFRVRYDAVADSVDVAIDDLSRSGGADPAISLVARAGAPLYLVVGVERDLECYAPPEGDPDPQCCYATSVGWTYREITIELCR